MIWTTSFNDSLTGDSGPNGEEVGGELRGLLGRAFKSDNAGIKIRPPNLSIIAIGWP